MTAHDPALSDEARVTAWLETNLGGKVAGIELHKRWRPAWKVELEKDGAVLPLYVRGERPEGLHTQPLEREFEVLKLLERNGVQVPHIYGWIPEPKAIVMERIDGRPYEGGAETDPVLRKGVENYMAHMAKVHAIDVEQAAAIGLHRPRGAEEIALAYFAKAEHAYEEGKVDPDPLVEFLRAWIRRNIPRHRDRVTLVSSDVPQFFHRDGEVLALFDLELAQIGDPLMDLASMRLRDTMEPTGDLGALFARYAEATGEPIDVKALSFYTILLFMCVSMIAAPSFKTNRPHPAFVEYLSWCLGTTRSTLQAMAEYLDIDLPEVPALQPEPSRHADALADLVAQAATLPPAEGHFREPPLVSLANYAKRAGEIGPLIDRLELAEASALLGRPFSNYLEADAALEAFVQQAGPERDAELVVFFYRREARRLQLLSDYPSPIARRSMGSLDGLPAALRAS